MFPHPETDCQLRDVDRRFLLDRLAREHAVRVASAAPRARHDGSDRHRALHVLRHAPRGLWRLPLARFVGAVETGRP
jgi:hypothetical protein